MTEFICGDSVVYQGYSYATTQIGNQCWFAENLRNEYYANGSVIPDPSASESDLWMTGYNDISYGATVIYGRGELPCYNSYEGDGSYIPLEYSSCEEEYALEHWGRLYNWYATVEWMGLCPIGWDVPTFPQWEELREFIISQGTEYSETSIPLRSSTGWNYDRVGTDDFGFNALPGGAAHTNFVLNDTITFSHSGDIGSWWTRSAVGTGAMYASMWYQNNPLALIGRGRNNLLSVRCIKNEAE